MGKVIENVLVGSDPEFFIKRGGKFFPSFNVIEGTKRDPFDIGNGYQILKDNVLLEGNIPPAESRQQFIDNLTYLKDYFTELLDKKDLILFCGDSGEFEPKFLRHHEANVFGCEPFMNCWDEESHRADDMSAMAYRVAGFHIHIGYDMVNSRQNRESINMAIAKAFDYFVTYPARLEHNDRIRARFYGTYGNYRNKPYGLECRSLGGYFLDEKYLGWVYDNVMKMVDYINSEVGLARLRMLCMDPNKFEKSNYEFLGIDIKNLMFNK